ncbi:hypothetical protein SK854_45715 [Lentzea sp. BCCO 10_0061]|uniref:Uncharacterized protein n=1 Tax=Lentzea sokolovensis TaxID=3095429 RepID=A0ABU4VCQ0_9PSEU|nr:hypothetical protein [Lentzea sp. BCCO 10_0061]MDX8149489.1 hypothetical protein [Lentzea sp. BCCO 10_0061]
MQKRRASVVTGLVALGILGGSGTAGAHTADVAASCTAGRTTLSISIANYNGSQPNSLLVADNEATLAATTSFGTEFRLTRIFDGAAEHTFTVSVKAWDDPSGVHGWSFIRKINVPRCTSAPPIKPVPAGEPAPPGRPAAPAAASSTSPAPAVSAPSFVLSTTEARSVLAGEEVPPSPRAPIGPLVWWAALTSLLLLGAGVTTVIALRRRKVEAPGGAGASTVDDRSP